MQKHEKALLIFSALALMVCIHYLSSFESDVTKGVLPTLIGVFTDAIIFVILLTFIQRREIKKEELRHKTELKSSIRSQLAIFFSWSQPIDSDVAGLKALTNERAIKTLVEEISTKKPLDSIQIKFFTDFAKREISSLEAMLPIAANIGPRHISAWSLILNNLKGVIDSESEDKSIECIQNFLHYSSEFDAIPIEI